MKKSISNYSRTILVIWFLCFVSPLPPSLLQRSARAHYPSVDNPEESQKGSSSSACRWLTAVYLRRAYNAKPPLCLRRFVDKQNRRSPFHFAFVDRLRILSPKPPPRLPWRSFCQCAFERRNRVLHILNLCKIARSFQP